MGVEVKVDLPFLLRDKSRHGKIRLYFRRPGQRMVRLRAELGTDEFLEEYRRAAQGETAPAPKPARIVAGSFRWLCTEYQRSAEFRTLGPTTQSTRRGILDSLCLSLTRTGAQRGTLPYALLQAHHVEEMRDEKLELPESANGRIKTLRQLFKWAVKKNHARLNPAIGVEYLPGSGEGWHTWTVDEVRQYEEHHPRGTRARLALDILLYTGVRRSDAVKLGRGMERGGVLNWNETKGSTSRVLGRKAKGPKRRTLPILPELRASLDVTPSGHMTWLVTEFGKPFSAAGFGNKMRDWCDAAGLPHCSAHGLRKAGATIAANNGATAHQLMAIYGWETLKQAEVYTRAADRVRLASQALHLVVPVAPLPLNRKVRQKPGSK